jgi:hypothetical protein
VRRTDHAVIGTAKLDSVVWVVSDLVGRPLVRFSDLPGISVPPQNVNLEVFRVLEKFSEFWKIGVQDRLSRLSPTWGDSTATLTGEKMSADFLTWAVAIGIVLVLAAGGVLFGVWVAHIRWKEENE